MMTFSYILILCTLFRYTKNDSLFRIHEKIIELQEKGMLLGKKRSWCFGYIHIYGFLGDASGKEPACQSRRHKSCRFSPCVRKIPWRKGQSTPVFLPKECHGQRSLAGYSSQGHKQLNTTEACTQTRTYLHIILTENLLCCKPCKNYSICSISFKPYQPLKEIKTMIIPSLQMKKIESEVLHWRQSS